MTKNATGFGSDPSPRPPGSTGWGGGTATKPDILARIRLHANGRPLKAILIRPTAEDRKLLASLSRIERIALEEAASGSVADPNSFDVC